MKIHPRLPSTASLKRAFWKTAAAATQAALGGRPLLRRLLMVAPFLGGATMAFLLGRLVGRLVRFTL